MRVVIGSYNIHFKLGLKVVAEDLQKLITTTRLDILGLQEMGKDSRVPTLNRLSRQLEWEFVRVDSASLKQDAVPIMWDNVKWQLQMSGSRRLHEPVEAELGAGGGGSKVLFVAWAVLRHRHSDKTIAVINWHAPASVENPRNIQRREAMFQATRSIVELVRELRSQVDSVFITGDMNVNYRRRVIRRTTGFPVTSFAKVGLVPNWHYGRPRLLGTHNPRRALILAGQLPEAYNTGRLIDYVFSTEPVTRSRILKGYKSDHRPVLGVYHI